MDEDIDADIGLTCTFPLEGIYGDATCQGTLSMHFNAPKEPIVTSPPVTTTKTTTKATVTTTSVSTTAYVISSVTRYEEVGVTCIEFGEPYVEALDQNYNYDDKEYNLSWLVLL